MQIQVVVYQLMVIMILETTLGLHKDAVVIVPDATLLAALVVLRDIIFYQKCAIRAYKIVLAAQMLQDNEQPVILHKLIMDQHVLLQ